MYKLAKPIRCPNCGEIVQVDTSMILTSYPPQYKWECPKCGRTGTVGSKDDIITFENQTPIRTLPYIQKVDEPDPGVGVTTTNATGGYNTINPTPVAKSTVTDPKSTACDIPAPKFIQQGWECPKCGAVLAPNQSYCPFCSPSGYGRSNWVVTTPVRVPLEQYTNPNPSTTISVGDKLKVTDSCTHTSASPCDNIKATL